MKRSPSYLTPAQAARAQSPQARALRRILARACNARAAAWLRWWAERDGTPAIDLLHDEEVAAGAAVDCALLALGEWILSRRLVTLDDSPRPKRLHELCRRARNRVIEETRKVLDPEASS